VFPSVRDRRRPHGTLIHRCGWTRLIGPSEVGVGFRKARLRRRRWFRLADKKPPMLRLIAGQRQAQEAGRLSLLQEAGEAGIVGQHPSAHVVVEPEGATVWCEGAVQGHVLSTGHQHGRGRGVVSDLELV
jgi:hypothetical protein